MKAAFIAFNGMTALDFIGFYDALTRLKSMALLPDFAWDVCALTPEVADDKGLRLIPAAIAQSLAGYDLIVVPGGFATRALQHDAPFVQWIKSAAAVPLDRKSVV